ncbi:MAG TPA: DegT/DnrJ/EryC1/StrS aminotransferase family protein [Candidatus Limnocylindrales bacterium]|nr:DegT/DnrJ/EryC1/StrS aminotransferase family protein [Candidatus Limnocylindrales bacterium]
MIKVSKGCLGEEELAAVREAFEYGYFGLASKVIEFEEALKNYLGAKHVIATNTGTAALHLALDALGVGEGDEVIVPSLTFVASFQAIKATGATPVPCDVEYDTLLMDLNDMERRITPKTKVLMPVHYAGNPCNMEALLEIKERYKLRVVEDAAHAFGSITSKGQKIGSFGDITCFSFDSIKNITCGEGGAVVCQEEALAELIRQKRLLGINRKSNSTAPWRERSWQFEVTTQGFRYHMSNINAAIGIEQLKKLDGFIARRREICQKYEEAFKNISGLQRLRINYHECAPHIYVIRVKDGRRNALMQFLKDRHIETGINYIPNHLHPYFRVDGLTLPVAEKAYEEILTLPLHCGLSDDEVQEVIRCVKQFFEECQEV